MFWVQVTWREGWQSRWKNSAGARSVLPLSQARRLQACSNQELGWEQAGCLGPEPSVCGENSSVEYAWDSGMNWKQPEMLTTTPFQAPGSCPATGLGVATEAISTWQGHVSDVSLCPPGGLQAVPPSFDVRPKYLPKTTWKPMPWPKLKG